MKRTLTLAALLACTAVSFAADNAKTAISKAYTQFDFYVVKGSLKDLESFLNRTSTNDFTMKQMGQTFDKKAVIAQMKQQLSMGKVNESKTKVKSIVINGSTATVMTSGSFKMTMKGKNQDKAHVFAGQSETKDTWVKEGRVWKMKSIESVSDKMTMDGKPINPGGGN
ncbi:MAG: nuclear transport factor 2 family protein [Armatimonadetes bacterium]|nr:nuclear transport factor 2 family protein [Armatimonadota bacterium]